MNALRSLGVGAVSFVLILLVVVGGYNLLALNLGTVTGDYFKGALAVMVLLGGAWLAMQGLGFIGKPFMVAAVLMLLVISVRHRAPGVAELVFQSAKAADRAAEHAAIDLSVPRTVPCDRTTRHLQFFDRHRPLLWLSESEDGRIVCWDRPGVHPQTNRELVAVDEQIAAHIRRQEPPEPEPAPEPAATPAPTPAPTPEPVTYASLPDLPGRPILQ